MTPAKGLGSGMPNGLVDAKQTIMAQWKRGAHGDTQGGNPIRCAAALATIDAAERESMANAATVGAYFQDELCALQAKHSSIGAGRGRGSRIGMERVLPDGAPANKLCDDLIKRAYHNGLLLSCSKSTVRFMPPLLITTADVDDALLMLEKSLVEAAAA